jgi:hypothetical protein
MLIQFLYITKHVIWMLDQSLLSHLIVKYNHYYELKQVSQVCLSHQAHKNFHWGIELLKFFIAIKHVGKS